LGCESTGRKAAIIHIHHRHFYCAIACNVTHGIVVAILSVRPSICPSDMCIVTKLLGWTVDILILHETAITLVF